MGRKASNPNAVPRLRVHRRKRTAHYYYDHGFVAGKRKLEPLGMDYARAIQRWAELEGARETELPKLLTLRVVAEQYRIEVIPTKAERTQRDNLNELGKLLEFFDDPPAPLDAIEAHDVKQYMRWRKSAPIRATREKALLSHLWNWARGEGYTDRPNPCAGIKGKKAGRDVYVEDDAYAAIWKAADATTRDAMDLAYLTGQRPADVLKMAETDIKDGTLPVRQGKTGAKLRMPIAGELDAVIERIKARKRGMKVYNTRLVVTDHGRSIGVHALSERFRKAREAAGIAGVQFKDLRAKAATDKAEASHDVRQAQRQMGHTSVTTTELYIRNRRGEKVTPTR